MLDHKMELRYILQQDEKRPFQNVLTSDQPYMFNIGLRF